MNASIVLRKWLAAGETERVIESLHDIANRSGDKYFLNEATHQSARFYSLEKDRKKGTISDGFYDQQLNRIREALQGLIERVPAGEMIEEPESKPSVIDTPVSARPPLIVAENPLPAEKRDDSDVIKPTVSPHIPRIVGLGLLVLSTILAVIVECPGKFMVDTTQVLLALGAAGVATILPGLLSIEAKGVKAGSAIGVFVVIYLVNPAVAITDERGCKSFSTTTVVVHGKKGVHDKILHGQGEVVIEFNKTEREKINDEGEAIFVKIPSQWLKEKVKIYVQHPQPYQAMHPDSLYQLQEDGKIYLEVNLNNADQLFGTITDASSGEFLDSVRVNIRSIAAYTDSNGWFELKIPADMQQKFQRVTLSKKGYETVTFDSIPVHTQKEFSYGLSRKKKVK